MENELKVLRRWHSLPVSICKAWTASESSALIPLLFRFSSGQKDYSYIFARKLYSSCSLSPKILFTGWRIGLSLAGAEEQLHPLQHRAGGAVLRYSGRLRTSIRSVALLYGLLWSGGVASCPLSRFVAESDEPCECLDPENLPRVSTARTLPRSTSQRSILLFFATVSSMVTIWRLMVLRKQMAGEGGVQLGASSMRETNFIFALRRDISSSA